MTPDKYAPAWDLIEREEWNQALFEEHMAGMRDHDPRELKRKVNETERRKSEARNRGRAEGLLMAVAVGAGIAVLLVLVWGMR